MQTLGMLTYHANDHIDSLRALAGEIEARLDDLDTDDADIVDMAHSDIVRALDVLQGAINDVDQLA